MEEHNGQKFLYSDEMLMLGGDSDFGNFDEQEMPDALIEEDESSESDLQVFTKAGNQWSRCVKKNLKKYVTEFENVMQCNVMYEQECHQVPKQVCSVTKINPKQIEKSFVQTICYNDDSVPGADNTDNNDPEDEKGNKVIIKRTVALCVQNYTTPCNVVLGV